MVWGGVGVVNRYVLSLSLSFFFSLSRELTKKILKKIGCISRYEPIEQVYLNILQVTGIYRVNSSRDGDDR
ncbi:hypothetical protein BGX38DRAFT_1209537 [Terfezia claveryi]|nr:hypothetical protein BGX38DRAFT_1209537 [Terfezia claveryi]